MKLTAEQLRKIIAEEVESAGGDPARAQFVESLERASAALDEALAVDGWRKYAVTDSLFLVNMQRDLRNILATLQSKAG